MGCAVSFEDKSLFMENSIRVSSGHEKSKTRGIQEDICCARCGDPEESINHVFLECPPTRQVWALSKIPSNPHMFPISSFSPIWTIFFGELVQRWMITNLH